MADVYVFGITPFAEMLKYYIDNHSNDKFIGYVVDSKYLPKSGKVGKDEVIPWESFVKEVPNDSCKIISSVTYNSMNQARELVFNRIKNAGFEMASFIHPSACIANNCKIGEGSIILENVTIQPFVTIGKNNVLWSNSCICHHTTVGDFNFFAASSAILENVKIGNKCFIGCNATIKNKVEIANSSLVGASAFVNKNTSENSVIVPERSIILNKKSSEMKI